MTVNGVTALHYADGSYVAENVSLVNGANTFTAIGSELYGRKATNILNLSSLTSVPYQYDANGNLLFDGKSELCAPTIAARMPAKSHLALEQLLGYEPFWTRKESSPTSN